MSERAPLPWDELLQLRAVARVREMLRRRWGLDLDHADGRTRAEMLQAALARHAAGDARPAVIASPASGHALALPVIASGEDGALLGVLVCSRFAREGHAGLLDAVALSQADVELVGALMALAADEIAARRGRRAAALRSRSQISPFTCATARVTPFPP